MHTTRSLRRGLWAPAGVRGAQTLPAGEKGKKRGVTTAGPLLPTMRAFGRCEVVSLQPFITKSGASGGHTPVAIETGPSLDHSSVKKDAVVGPLPLIVLEEAL